MTASLSRRKFLGLCAAGAGAAMLGPARLLRAADQFGGFAMGLQTYSLREFPVDKVFPFAHEIGVTTLEYFPGHLAVASSQAEIDKIAT